MKKEILLFCLFIVGILNFSIAQTTVKTQVNIPPGQQFSKGQEHQLQIAVSGVSSDSQTIKEYITNITTVPGVVYFNMIIQPEQTSGYCDLRFDVSSRKDLEIMLKEIFCRLDAKSIKINDSTFENCQQITLP